MATELYKDQFTPWVPNHWTGEQLIPADTLGGAIIGHMLAQDKAGLLSTSNLIYATLSTNFYLDMFAANSLKLGE